MSRQSGSSTLGSGSAFAWCAAGIFGIVLFLMFFKNRRDKGLETKLDNGIYVGPKGGMYYINSKGSKTYLTKEQKQGTSSDIEVLIEQQDENDE